MAKFYAVKKGKKTGVFLTWDECKEQVTGFKGAVYKSFKTLPEAEAFLEESEAKIENVEKVDGVYAYIEKIMLNYIMLLVNWKQRNLLCGML